MPSDFAIEVVSLSKRYDTFESPAARLRALLFGRSKKQAYFEALKPLSFAVERGCFLGIIGQNGSGKSTLLQIISGILTPTTGRATVHGRIAALLELGAGFNPEFTGRENAKLNAQILGIAGREFERLLPEIEQFADIGAFIDQPVKTYSSGMFVRLAFAIQACIDPDVLIVDEALAVGDIFFRLKCYERLERLRAKGCTVILVTHSMEDVMHYCDQALLLHHGDAVYFGDTTEAINRYYALGKVGHSNGSDQAICSGSDVLDAVVALPGAWPTSGWQNMMDRAQAGDGRVRCLRLVITNGEGETRQIFSQYDMLRLHAEFEVYADLETPVAGVVLRSDRGIVVHGKNTGQCHSPVPRYIRAGQIMRFMFELPLDLGCGEYVLDVGFATWPTVVHEHAAQVSMAELEASASRHCVLTAATSFSIVARGHLGFDAQPFYGVVSLNSVARLVIKSSD